MRNCMVTTPSTATLIDIKNRYRDTANRVARLRFLGSWQCCTAARPDVGPLSRHSRRGPCLTVCRSRQDSGRTHNARCRRQGRQRCRSRFLFESTRSGSEVRNQLWKLMMYLQPSADSWWNPSDHLTVGRFPPPSAHAMHSRMSDAADSVLCVRVPAHDLCRRRVLARQRSLPLSTGWRARWLK
jgi:hypothetical protein